MCGEGDDGSEDGLKEGGLGSSMNRRGERRWGVVNEVMVGRGEKKRGEGCVMWFYESLIGYGRG